MSNHLGGYQELIIQAPILISPKRVLEFHVHIYAFQLAIGAILA